mmetsp:Transcript_45000/g.101233  ORF Transcript_45000/g.101233 Transcript_45000/m.101233 type:complete len:170 (-) Transcript_45000:50-559(-)
MHQAVSLLLLCQLATVAADAPAASSLREMLAWIGNGKADNNFEAGEVMKKPKGPDEEVGACLLDKIGAILWEDAVQKFINDFQVDLAACCTRQTPCPATVDKAYDLLVDVKEARQSAVDGAPKIAALLIQSAVPLIDPKRVAKKYSMLLSRCNGPVEDCTMQILKGAEL